MSYKNIFQELPVENDVDFQSNTRVPVTLFHTLLNKVRQLNERQDTIMRGKCLSRSQTGSNTAVPCNRLLIHKAAVPDSDIKSKPKQHSSRDMSSHL